jgi:capsular polysaccharide biosynthesis protein
MPEATSELKITYVSPHPAKLRSMRPAFHWLVKCYRRFIKPIAPMRAAALFAWKFAFPLYLSVVSCWSSDPEVRKWRRLVPFRSFTDSHYDENDATLAEAAYVKTRAPIVVPNEYQSYISSQDGYLAPEVCIRLLKNARINGGSNLIQCGDTVVCHDLFDLQRDYTSEELHGRLLVSAASCRVRWLHRDEEPAAMDVAASFVDACAPNYAHWLTEVLPRLALYCGETKFEAVPIIINAGLHKNILESLSYFVSSNREIVALSTGRALEVKELHATSVAGYVPFGKRKRRGAQLPVHSQGQFNPNAFERLRAVLLPEVFSLSAGTTPKKFYIRRNSGSRRVTNAAELEAALVMRGYTIVEPEKLSFIEQVRLFASAQTIIGSSGAALANIVFAPSSSKIYVLIGRYQDTSFWYWQNIASAIGGNVNYVFGEIEGDAGEEIHADFQVDVPLLLKTIDSE